MFGKNKLTKVDAGDGLSLVVHSVFHTIQGEGPLSGRPAVFVRLAFCNLACFFCDTEFEQGAKTMAIRELVEAVVQAHSKSTCDLVVITGGEPMRQPLKPFVQALQALHYDVQIETAGTVWPKDFEHCMVAPSGVGKCSIVCSPKTGGVHPMIEKHCRDWKFVIAVNETASSDGLPMFSTQRAGVHQRLYRPKAGTIWLQPREEYMELAGGGRAPDRAATRFNVNKAVEVAMRFGYRISLQTHKILELP